MYAIPQSRFNRPLPPVRRRRKERGGSGKAAKVRITINWYLHFYLNTVTKVSDFPRYNTKWSGENEICTTRNTLCSISFSSTFRVISMQFGLTFNYYQEIAFWNFAIILYSIAFCVEDAYF